MRVFLLLPLLMLTACGAASPTWVPAGYTNLNNEYKAQPGPEAKSLGYPYSSTRNEYIGKMWGDVAHALVDDLESKTGMTAQSVYIEQLPQSNAFNMSLDNALREELRDRSYTLADTPGENVHIKYQAFKAGDEKKHNELPYNGDVKKSNEPWDPNKTEKFTFVLTLIKNGAAFSEVRDTRLMPAYGYVSGEGNLVPGPHMLDGSAATEAEAVKEGFNP